MNSTLIVQNLKASIQSNCQWVDILNNVTFSVDQEQIVGLVGESGSGKTFTIYAILKLLSKKKTRIDAKKLQIGNIDLLNAGEKLMQKILGSQVGFVIQNAQNCLNPSRKIKDQMIEGMIFHKLFPTKESAMREAIRLLDLVEIANSKKILESYPFELSGGMRQRVAIATTIAAKPKLLIADEPTSSLDLFSQEATLNLLKSLQKELKMSILLITHDLSIAKNFCDKIVVMYEGRTVETLNLQESIYPIHPYTKYLMASKPSFKTDKSIPLMTLKNPLNINKSYQGCPFAKNCEYSKPICHQKIPETIQLQKNHFVDCFLADLAEDKN